MDGYSIEKRIGQGAFGIAMLVRSKKDNKRYCVKEINTARMSLKEREDARKEVAVIAQLDHPNIVRYCESFQECGCLKIVMEFCDGGDLYSKIGTQRGVLFPEDQIIDWFVQISLALKHMHDRKILHRDLKSQNIFMLSNGQLKLGDFGIAKILNSTMEFARTAIGTPYYLSPEICEGRPYNNKSDIWSLGCVLYELTTLKHAFEAGNMKNLVAKIIRGTYPPISPLYSYELRTVVSQLFKRNPRERPGINAILRKPLLARRIEKFLTEGERKAEFSHTVMHGKKISKVVPPKPSPAPSASGDGRRTPNVGRPLPPCPMQPAGVKRPSASPAPRRYDPAAVYGAGAGVGKRPRPNVPASPRVPPSPRASPSPRPSTPQQQKQKAAEAQKGRDRAAEIARQYKEMMEKQKREQMNKAREAGWRNVLSSDSGSSQEQPRAAAPSPRPIGDFGAHHEALDRLRQDRQKAPERSPPVYMDADPAPPSESPTAAREAAAEAQARGAEAAEKARVVQEFLERKREAASNRARGRGMPMGGAPAVKEQGQEDYLDRLRQIRNQNLHDRRNLQEHLVGGAGGGVAAALGGNADAIRREKIEKLKQQAEERAQRLKGQLEQRRLEAMNKEKERLRVMREEMAGRREAAGKPSAAPADASSPAVPAAPAASKGRVLFPKKSEDPTPTPAPVLAKGPSITVVMQQLQGDDASAAEDRKRKKENILKRLNAKKVQEEGRGKWEADPLAAEDLSKMTLEEARGRWGAPPTAARDLSQMTLEAGSQDMEVSVALEEAARKQWGGGNSVVNFLAEADILKTTNVSSPAANGKSSGTSLTRKGTFSIGKAPQSAQAKASEAAVKQPNDGVEHKEAISNEKPSQTPGIGSTLPLEKPTLENVEIPEAPGTPASPKHGAGLSPLLSMVAEAAEDDVTIHEERKEEKKKEEDKAEALSEEEIDRLAKAALRSLSDEESTPKLIPQPEEPLQAKSQMPPSAVKLTGEGALFEKLDRKENPSAAKDESMAVEDMEVEKVEEKKEEKEEEKEEEDKEKKEEKEEEDKEKEKKEEAASVNSSEDDEDMELLRKSYQSVLESVEAAEAGEEDENANVAPKLRAKTTKDASEMKMCLTLGKFDVASATALRTCSLPDLTKLFDCASANLEPLQLKERARSADLDKEFEESDDEIKKEEEKEDEEEEEEDVEEEDDEENIDEEDEDDMLESVRESMQTVLELTEDSSSSVTENTVGGTNDSDVFESIEDEETTESMEWDDDDGEDEDEEFGDEDEEGGADIFLRLERMREELEEAVGSTQLLKAYNVVQALQEDEDESVAECQKALLPILGEAKMQYYDRIVQLVLADGVFMEDD